MSNNLSQIEKLVLKGYFKRSEKSKQEEVEEIDLSKISAEAKEILKFKNQDFKFEVDILYFNSESERFIARGDDVCGESVIYGTIKYGGKMKFKKVYVGNPRHGLRVARANSVDYSGWIEVSEKRISCIGTYETHPDSPENGKWELSSVKEPT